MHWVSKVVEATVGAAERRADIQHERSIARKQLQIERVLSADLHSSFHGFEWFDRREIFKLLARKAFDRDDGSGYDR